MKINAKHRVLLLVATLLCLAGCSSDGCFDNGSAVPLAGFYSATTGSGVTIDSLTVQGVGAPGDSCLALKESVSQLYLPLRSTTSTTQFSLDYNAATVAPDTITFHYTPVPTFVSRDCGAMFFYDIASVDYTTHLIDSVAVLYPTITNQDRVSIKIYMR